MAETGSPAAGPSHFCMHARVFLLLCLSAVCLGAQVLTEEVATVSEPKVNVRGQPSLLGEVITQLQRGDKVTILERVATEKPKAGEPTEWARIKLPANTPVWIFAPFARDGVVSVTRLNLRAGPGENYSVIGRLQKGDALKPIRTIEEWMEIEAPEGAYAFVDASLVQKTGGATVPTVPPPPVVSAPSAANVAKPPLETPAPTEAKKPAPPANLTATPSVAAAKPAPAPPATLSATPAPSVPTTDALKPATIPATEVKPPPARPIEAPVVAALPAVTAPVQQPPPATVVSPAPSGQPARRVVRRDGIVRTTKSIQAPTWYELIHPETRKVMDYLNPEGTDVKLKDYKGKRVVVSGTEGIDDRWPNTPILQIETIEMAP